MGRISTSIGLITGTPINDTVDQLISISAQPRDRLQRRVDLLKQQQKAITDLTVMTIGLQLAAKGFGTATAFQGTTATSSNADALSVSRTGTPRPGSYSIRTLQTAATDAFVSQPYASADKAFGTTGTLTIRGGGFVDRSARLSELNAGRGVASGSIRITDRSGTSETIDLSGAATIDDVLRTINESSKLRIRATTDGDSIRLQDVSGEILSNLRVEEVGGGSTAADLGLRGIDTASTTANGADIYRLSSHTRLSSLRDGRGLGFSDGDDLDFTFRNGTTLALDFGDFSRPASQSTGSTSNADPNGALTFTATETGADADGTRIRFVDDPTVAAGSETVQLIDGTDGAELVFAIEAGVSTAADVAAALAADPELSEKFSAVASGDGTGQVSLDDAATLAGGAEVPATDTPDVGDLLRVLNAADPARLQASISADGDSIELTDLTTGVVDFGIQNAGSSRVASDLGIAGTSNTGTITGARLQSGLQSVSLGALGGGSGLGALTSIDVTTRNGATANVDVSQASTLQDVLNAINDSGLAIEATVDPSGAGVQLRDLSGGTAGSFSVSSVDDTAARLGLAASTEDTVIRGSSLDLQFVDRGTRLADLNQGRGVGGGSFKITDSLGATSAVNIKAEGITTVGELIDAINSGGTAVTAVVNDTGDGIRLIDTGNGAGTMTITDSGTGTTAAQLGLAGSAKSEVVDGEVVSTINGRQIDTIHIRSDDTLTSIAARLQENGRFASAAIVGGGTDSASLSITSRRGGEAGRLTVSSEGIDLGLRQSVRGRDAVIAIGGGDGGASSIFRSADGVFDDAVEGLSFTAKVKTDAPVTITVSEDYSKIESAVKRFVEQYNKLAEKLDELTFFNAEDGSSGLLFGSGEALRIESSLGRLISGRFNASDALRSAAEVGIRLNENGRMDFDAAKLNAAIKKDSAQVEAFFTTEESGFVAKLDRVIDSLAGENNSLLLNRAESLSSQVDRNNQRIEGMNERLAGERDRLLKQYYAMEAAIAKLQTNQQYLSRIEYFGPPD